MAWLVVDVGGQSANPPLTYQPPSATSTPPGSLPPYDDPLYGDPLYGPADDQPSTSPSPTSPPPNRPPTVTLRTVDSKIPQNGSTTLIATASDLDGRIVTYAFFRDGTEMQSGQSDYHIYNHPIVGRRQFTVTVTDDRGAQATSEAVTIDVTGSSGPVMPVGQWADVNGDGIYDQVLATIKLQRDLSLQSVSNGMSAKIFKRTYVTQTVLAPFSFGISLFNDNDWGSSFGLFDLGWGSFFTIDEWYMACVRIPSSLTPRGFDYQLQYRAFTNAWVSTGPAFPGSIGGIGYCPDTLAEEVIDWLPEFIRFVRLLNKSSEVGAPIMTDVNGDGVDDRVQQVSVQVRGVDDETNELIISVECPEDTIGCEAPVIKRDGKWSELEDNKDAIEIVRPEDPDFSDDVSPGERAKQVYRVIKNRCWGDSPPLGQLVNFAQCLPIGFAEIALGEIVPDYNRDGRITAEDSGWVSEGNPWRFWLNDDNDFGEDGGTDIPDVFSTDYGISGGVDGVRDLVDFFPVHFNISDALEEYPRTEGYSYYLKREVSKALTGAGLRVLWYPEAVLHEAPTDNTAVGGYLKNTERATSLVQRSRISGSEETVDGLREVKGNGVKIPEAMLVAAGLGKGVALFEAAAPKLKEGSTTRITLILEIRKTEGGTTTTVGEIRFPVSLSGVEQMYRRVDLGENVLASFETLLAQFGLNQLEGLLTNVLTNVRQELSGVGGLGGVLEDELYEEPEEELGSVGGTLADIALSPKNWPDLDRNGKHFIFVHGYRVNEEEARGWHAEMFKRMFWSGSNAMFTAVSWNGNEQDSDDFFAADFWSNVHNAFQTSRSLAVVGNLLPGFDRTIAAHSLGNDVVSSAIVDHGLRVSNYYMINSSAPLEAYAAGARNRDEMRHPQWEQYDEHLWSTEWHTLFQPTDARRRMTWRGRFGPLPNAYNFYSTGEEVLRNGTGVVPSIGRDGSWVRQEMRKGFEWAGGSFYHENASGGWVFGEYWNVAFEVQVPVGQQAVAEKRRRTPEEARSIPRGQLGQHPFFKPFHNFNGNLHDPVQGPIAARSYDRVSRALAESLPALSFATGSNPVDVFEPEVVVGDRRNFDMMDLRSGWPESRGTDTDWKHSDIRAVAYLYAYKVFDKFIELGGLDR